MHYSLSFALLESTPTLDPEMKNPPFEAYIWLIVLSTPHIYLIGEYFFNETSLSSFRMLGDWETYMRKTLKSTILHPSLPSPPQSIPLYCQLDTWEEGPSIEEFSRSDWPVTKSVRDCLD